MQVAAGQVRKSVDIHGVGLGIKNCRDGQFSLLLYPTTSVGGEVDEARDKQFTFTFLTVRSLQVIIKYRVRLRMVVTPKNQAGLRCSVCWSS